MFIRCRSIALELPVTLLPLIFHSAAADDVTCVVAPSLSVLTRGVVFGICDCVFREQCHTGSGEYRYTAFVEQVRSPSEVSTVRETAAFGKSFSRL